jgi:hypothetical protein
MTPPDIELIVARHREDLAWLRRVPRTVRLQVYDKSGAPPAPGHRALPNVGREAHTYLHHLVEHYDALPDLLVCVQGHPFDHAPDLHKRLRALAEGRERVEAFRWLGFLVDEDDATGSRLFQRWSKNPEHTPLDMRGFWRAVFGDGACPERFVFFGGGQFIVARETIRRRPRAFYARARDVAAGFPDAAHGFERCWDAVFGVDGLPPELRGQPLPIFLKPIRRLREPSAG